jgi:hypothetical protein
LFKLIFNITTDDGQPIKKEKMSFFMVSFFGLW